ncbi:tyrosine--tRNA ligase [Arsenophonus symbiont of Ornithomya chloropus]|uniref:tyrosine--tRNA ligase n=1 Tax=Arsenophonus symbiont of Ornithomya chloropus TaxID=634121 RepID=UPI0032B2AE83
MVNEKLLQYLKNRSLINQLTDERYLSKKLSNESINLYCGFDPTADSLHLGHLVPLLSLKHFQKMGHKPIILIGGGTALIGDPSFKSHARKLQTFEMVSEWVNKISQQILPFLDFDCSKNSAKIINNYDWISKINLLTFLRDIGKYFSVNQMIHKEAVKKRLERDNNGICFSEFFYSLLQSYDFAYLFNKYNVKLQIGGSDQWGNIISGIDLTRRLYQKKVFGLTVPLIIKSDGTKFGKTEDGVIWLDPKKTSPYKFYQFWINTKDVDVYRFLKIFTFIPIEEIEVLQKEDQNSHKKNRAQYLLAEKITQFVHGNESLQAAKRITKNLFFNNINQLSVKDFIQLAQDGVPIIKLHVGANLQEALIEAQFVFSRGQSRKIIKSNAVMINGKKCSDPAYVFTEKDRLFERYSLIKRGKKNYCLVYWK